MGGCGRCVGLPPLHSDYPRFGPIETRPALAHQELWPTAPQLGELPHWTPPTKRHHRAGSVPKLRRPAIIAASNHHARFPDEASVVALSSIRNSPSLSTTARPRAQSLIPHGIAAIHLTPVVPVIRDADKKGLLEIAKELGAVSERMRAGKISPADLQGGCFSISSLGGIGGTLFTPIINAPEVAILGVGKAVMKPVGNGNAFAGRLMLPLSLSYSPVIDGSQGARFISTSRAFGYLPPLLYLMPPPSASLAALRSIHLRASAAAQEARRRKLGGSTLCPSARRRTASSGRVRGASPGW